MGKVFWIELVDLNVFCDFFFSKCLEIISADAPIAAVTTMFVWQVVIWFQTSCSYLYESIKEHVMRNKLTVKQQINISFYRIQLIEQKNSGKRLWRGQKDQEVHWISEMCERYLDERAELSRSGASMWRRSWGRCASQPKHQLLALGPRHRSGKSLITTPSSIIWGEPQSRANVIKYLPWAESRWAQLENDWVFRANVWGDSGRPFERGARRATR